MSAFLLTLFLYYDAGSVWIAPSSLKGFAGYGVFTTRDLAKGEHIIGRPDGVAVPIETEWDRKAPKKKERNNWANMWGNYMYVVVDVCRRCEGLRRRTTFIS